VSDMRNVMVGIAGLLNAAGVGKFIPSGVYATTDTGIIFKIMPDGTGVPDRVIVLNAFVLTADVSMPADRVLLQVALRGVRNNPLDVDDLGDAVFDVLHGATYKQFGTASAAQILFSTSVPMGEDALTRSTRADRYFIDLDATPTNLRPTGGSWT
jgi:hypothetical protein